MRMASLREHDITNHHYNYHYDFYMHRCMCYVMLKHTHTLEQTGAHATT